MNKKRITFILSSIVIVIIAGFFIIQKRSKVVVEQKQNIAQKQTIQQAEDSIDQNDLDRASIDTSDWITFKNDEFGFEMKYPKNFTYANQHAFNAGDGAEFLFYDSKFVDVAKSDNPLNTIMSKNTGYMEFIVNTRKHFINKSDYNMKEFATRDLSGPSGATAMTQKLMRWIPVKTINGKTMLHFYTTDATDVDTLRIIGHANGATWISNDNLFILEPKGDVKKIGDLYENMALTFSQE